LICQALCLYRKEADNRQDHYEELHQDSESVPDDLILVSHDDVILPIGKRKARHWGAAPGLTPFLPDTKCSKVLVAAMGAQDFSRQRKTLLPKRKGDD
jgi:hypothetical protein